MTEFLKCIAVGGLLLGCICFFLTGVFPKKEVFSHLTVTCFALTVSAVILVVIFGA